MLAGYDDDLAAQSTRLTNRLREAILHIHPALERLLGKHFDRPGVLELLAAAPTPTALRELGADGMTTVMRARSPRLAKTLPAKILAALDAQTVHVPGTTEFGRVIAGTAATARHPARTRQTRRRTPGPPGRPPPYRGPDLDAGCRVQDRREDPDHRW